MYNVYMAPTALLCHRDGSIQLQTHVCVCHRLYDFRQNICQSICYFLFFAEYIAAAVVVCFVHSACADLLLCSFCSSSLVKKNRKQNSIYMLSYELRINQGWLFWCGMAELVVLVQIRTARKQK